MNTFWSPIVEKLTPYVAGEQSADENLVKLNTNENPYAPSPSVSAILKNYPTESLRLYPDPESNALKQALAQYFDVPQNYVFCGNGSDEVLAHTFMGLLKQDKPLLMPDITYSFYPVYCQLYDIDFDSVAIDESFAIDVEDYARPSGAVILPNPNAPTGRLLSLDEIETLLKQDTARLIVIDEAYIDFGGKTAISLCQDYANLLVIQTLSKSRSLAALRIGFAIGQPHLIEALNRVKNSFNSYPLSRIAIDCGVAALKDNDYFQQCRNNIIKHRDEMTHALQTLGFTVLPSAANFIFCQHNCETAQTIYQALRKRSILVRHFKKPRIDNYLRISIGTAQQNQTLINTLSDILS